MTDKYHAGTIKVSVKLDTSMLEAQFNSLERHLAASGKKASKTFQENLTSEFKAGFGDKFKSSVFEALDSSKPAEKAGSFVVAGFSRAIEKSSSALKTKLGRIGKIMGGALKGGFIGIGFELLSAGAGLLFKKLTEGARKAKEEQERYNRKVEDFYELIESNNQFLKKYDAILNNEDIDLLDVATGRVSALSGKYNTLFRSLNSIHQKTFLLKIEGLEKAKKDAEDLIDAQNAIISTNQFTLDNKTPSRSSYYTALNALENIAGAKEKRTEQQKIADDAGQQLLRFRKVDEQLTKGNRQRAFEELKRHFRLQQINALRANGNEAEAKALEDQLSTHQEIHRLRKLGVPEPVAKFLAPTFVKNARRAQESGLNSGKEENTIDASTQIDLHSALKSLGSEDKASFEKAIAEAQNKQDYIRQMLDSSQQLIQEAETPFDEYEKRLRQLKRIANDDVLGGLSGGFETFSKLQIKALKELVGQTGDYEDALKRLVGLQHAHDISSEQFSETLSDLLGPIDNVDAAIEHLRQALADGLIKDEAIDATNRALVELGSRALKQLLDGSLEIQTATERLLDLQQNGMITIDQFGQAFQDLTDPIEGAGEALERLSKLSEKNVIDPVFFEAAKAAIEASEDFEANLKERQIARNQDRIIELEDEASELRRALELAEIRNADGAVEKLEERLDVIREAITHLNDGTDLDTALNRGRMKVEKDRKNEEEEKHAKLEADVKDFLKGGIKAAIDGDFEDFLAGKLQGAADSMFDNAIDTLLDSLLGAGGPLESLIGGLFGGEGGGDDLLGNIFGNLFGGGQDGATGEATDALGNFTSGLTAAEGGLGQFGGALGALAGLGGGITELLGGDGKIGGLLGILPGLFAGFFADGGVVPRGQFAIVGEEGPEIISAGASPLRVTPMNDNYTQSRAARLSPDGGGARAMSYAPINNFYGHTQDDLRRSLDERDRALKADMPGMMDRHTFNQRRGMA